VVPLWVVILRFRFLFFGLCLGGGGGGFLCAGGVGGFVRGFSFVSLLGGGGLGGGAGWLVPSLFGGVCWLWRGRGGGGVGVVWGAVGGGWGGGGCWCFFWGGFGLLGGLLFCVGFEVGGWFFLGRREGGG